MLCQDHSFDPYLTNEPQLHSGGEATWGITTNTSTPDYLRPDEPAWKSATGQQLFSDALILTECCSSNGHVGARVSALPTSSSSSFLVLPQIQDTWQWAYLPHQTCFVSPFAVIPAEIWKLSLNLAFPFSLTSRCSSRKKLKACHFWKGTQLPPRLQPHRFKSSGLFSYLVWTIVMPF